MRRVRCPLPAFLLLLLLLLLTVTAAERIFQPGPRVCSAEVQSRAVSSLVSHAQPVYQPYLTECQGYRLCSTYRTTYRIAQRPAYRTVSQPAYTCCPGWRRASRRPGLGCNIAVCQPPCQHGGKCVSPNKCSCPLGWTGRCCQTDVDECAGERRHGCSHFCLNLAGSYRCACQPGYQLRADRKTCQAPDPPPEAPLPTSPAGVAHPAVSEEVKELRSRVAALEEKLQLALAPFLQLEAPGLEGITTDPISLLAYSLQQLDRIDSLSEQISFLEERLETCSCKNEL